MGVLDKHMGQKKEQTVCNVKNNECLDLYKIFWVFVVFSVVGTLSEGIYWIFRYGHFALRTGMIYGPFSQVYGLATVLALVLLYSSRNKSSLYILFIAYVISVGFEFTCSIVQEWVFGYTSWDYYDSKYALLGRANLIYAVGWALFGLLLVKYIYPWFCGVLSRVPRKPGIIITWVVLLFMVFNAVVSAAAINRYQQRQNNIPATSIIQIQLDQHYPDAFLEKRFARLGRK
jgi:uncharacterized membrane protein